MGNCDYCKLIYQEQDYCSLLGKSNASLMSKDKQVLTEAPPPSFGLCNLGAGHTKI